MRTAMILPILVSVLLLAPTAGQAQTITCEPASSPLLTVTNYTLTQGNLLPSQV
jgi:hypothetical protein